MCPPATTPPDAIGLYWTDEQIFLLLEKVTNGSALPDNVSEDINPYWYLPSNLPPKIWYLVQPTESKKTEHGFWKAKGEAHEIYQNRSIYGWRSTLEFYEGPNGQKTDWVMQEYKITQKGGHNEKSQKHCRALCTVFHCFGGSPNDMQLEKKPAVAARGNVANSILLSAPNVNSTSGVGSTSESQAKSKGVGSTQSPLLETSKDAPVEYLLDCILSDEEDFIEIDDLAEEDPRQLPAVDEAKDPRNEALISQLLKEDLELDDRTKSIRQSPAANKAEDPHSEALSDQLKEGFIELNDLEVILSHSSSSGNSSHQSLVSDDDFFALVRNMDDENNGDLKGKDSSYKCRNMGPVRPEVIIQPAPLESLVKGTGSEAAVESLPTSSTKPAQTQLLGGQCQITEKKVHQTLRPAATKNKFKKVYGVAEKLYCDRRRTKET